MSSEQTPKEYIITESIANHVCAILVNCGENKMANRVVSRPHPAPAPCPQHQIWQHCPVAGEIARKAREDVLNHIATYCACHGVEERIIGGDRFYEVEGVFSLQDFLNYIQSLRHPTPQSEQEQPQ